MDMIIGFGDKKMILPPSVLMMTILMMNQNQVNTMSSNLLNGNSPAVRKEMRIAAPKSIQNNVIASLQSRVIVPLIQLSNFNLRTIDYSRY